MSSSGAWWLCAAAFVMPMAMTVADAQRGVGAQRGGSPHVEADLQVRQHLEADLQARQHVEADLQVRQQQRSDAQKPAGAAWLIRSLENPAESREARSDVLDTPILPGSVIKAVTLVAAIEAHAIEPDTARMCRRTVTVGGRRYTCSHPDLKRPLTAAEALAHSCNDYFLSLAARLSRAEVNGVRARIGLPPIAAASDFAAALVGLDGPRVTPRALLAAMASLIGAGRQPPATVSAPARRVLLEGLQGAGAYGSASELASRQIPALAKTGTASMPGGGVLGLLVAFVPAAAPSRALVVVAPGAAGRDAVSIAGDLIGGAGPLVRVGFGGSGGNNRIESLALEDYVARVLAGEGQPAAADAAQAALAIAARTYALANRSRHRDEGFDVCDTTHCQVLRNSTSLTRRIAAATTARVLLDRGRPASIYYSASCGGRSELPSNVWPGAMNHSFDRARHDEACAGEPAWKSDVAAADIERALRVVGLKGGRLGDFAVVRRSASGRAMRLRAEGFSPAEVSAQDFRTALGRTAGWQLLKSTMFEMRRTPRGYAFTGRGAGHGVGLCIIGAGVRAARGATTAQILESYYPGLRVMSYVEPPEPGLASAAPPGVIADLELALPAAEEGERALVSRIVRQARDELAAKTGIAPPPVIRVTVHPDVSSFGRDTGLPWWVAGATDRVSVALLPVAVLRQRGQLQRTIRHEVAHVLLDSSLSGRPLWVREGAASYFAGPQPRPARAESSRAGAPCPSDTELLKAPGVDAQRDAYARATACFARAMASGKQWREVR